VTATSLAAEKDLVNEVTGIRQAATCDLLLLAYQGRTAAAESLFAATIADAMARGEGLAVHLANWAAAVLRNGLGRYAEALAGAEAAAAESYRSVSTQWVLPELIEAAVRTRRAGVARDALDRLSAMTAIEGSDWAKGLEARSRALVSEGREAEQCYAEAVERLGRTPLRPEAARSHLLFGEWLRRENRRTEARHQLTSQEEHIVRLARDGRTNTEITAKLFLSTRTVEWHLRKVYAKLGITSRRDLHDSVPPRGQQAPSG
jgi:DNA-binding NarL/FixJ family response regulator